MEIKFLKLKSCSSKDCRKRHPKVRKYFRESEFCKYGKGCAYAHVEQVNRSEIKIMTEVIKNMKAKMHTLQMKVGSISDVKKEGKVMMNMIQTLKEDIQNIKYAYSEECGLVAELIIG